MIIACMPLLLPLSGCDEQASVVSPEIGEPSPLASDELRKTGFLNPAQSDIAARWLAVMAHRDDAAYRPTAEEIAEYERRIANLDRLTLEDRRMVANRTVQIRDILAQQNIHETLPTLLDGMLVVADARVVGNYGAYCQWYVNLRQSGLSHPQTLEKMKSLKHLQ